MYITFRSNVKMNILLNKIAKDVGVTFLKLLSDWVDEFISDGEVMLAMNFNEDMSDELLKQRDELLEETIPVSIACSEEVAKKVENFETFYGISIGLLIKFKAIEYEK